MDAIEYVDAAATVPDSPWVPFFAGLIAAGAAAAILCRLPSRHSLSGVVLFLLAAGYVVAIAVASAIATRCAGSILPDSISRCEIRRLIRFEWLAVLWFPLLALLSREASPWAIVITALVSVTTTKAILKLRTSNEPSSVAAVDSPPQYKFLQVPNSAPLIRGLFPVLCVAACAQAGMLALLMNHLLESAALFAICSSLSTWRVSAQSSESSSAPTKAFAAPSRIRLMFFLPILFTFAALLPYGLNYQYGIRLRGHLHGQLLFPPIVPLEHRVQVEQPKTSYSGVILWPVQKKPRKISAPSPVSNLLLGAAHATILKIPFDGVYWYFKAPDTRPEPDAHIQHGSPAKIDVRSTDWRPIVMEARQNLGTLVDLNCCSHIRVAIQNADNRPGKIALGVILTNTTLPGKPSLYLGQSPVVSSHAIQFSIDRPPVSEVLDFRIPNNSKIRQFNEITVLFRPASERSMAGAKIAIEEFSLVPRGL